MTAVRGSGSLGIALDEFLLRGELTIRNDTHSLLGTDTVIPLLNRWRGTVLTNQRAVSLHCPTALAELPTAITFQEVILCASGVASVDPINIIAAAQRVELGGTLHLIAENRRGAERLLGWCTPLHQEFSSPTSATRAHCRLVSMKRSVIADTSSDASVHESPDEPQPVQSSDGLLSLPGVFCANRIDEGTSALIEFLESVAPSLSPLPATILELGCGYGALGIAALNTFPAAKVHFVDIDMRAVRSAQLNINRLSKEAARRGTTFWLDATVEPLPQQRYDLILLNPPFHAAGAEQRDLGNTLTKIAVRSLSRNGTLLFVGNSHLQYRALFEKLKDASIESSRQVGAYELFHVRKQA